MKPEPSGQSERKVVGGYAVLEKLGRGSDGVVYLAESTDGLGKRVALKVFRGGSQAAFERELEAYGELERIRRESGSPHLVEGLAAGTRKRGGGYIALAYQPGGTLADLVRERRTLPADEALALIDQLLAGLEVLHGAGLRHGDVKPTNALLGADGVLRVGDFGLSGDKGSHGPGGTPGFAAPELYGPDAPDSSPLLADLYGAAATLYFLLVGRPPLPGAPDVLALEACDVPRALHPLLLDALDRDPAARPPDVATWRRSLAEAQEGAPAPAVEQRPTGKHAALAAAGLALVLGLSAWLLGEGTPLPPPEVASTSTSRSSSPQASPTTEAAAVPSTPAVVEESPADVHLAALEVARDGTQSLVRLGVGEGARVLYRSPVGPLLAARLDAQRVLVAVPATERDGPRLLTFGADGERRATLNLSRPAALLTAQTPYVVLATSDGAVFAADLSQPSPRLVEVARYAHAVHSLDWEGGRLRVEGDQRAPQLLAAGQELPPGHLLLEGARGRYAFAERPDVQRIYVDPAQALGN